jgi:hypothetical protein
MGGVLRLAARRSGRKSSGIVVGIMYCRCEHPAVQQKISRRLIFRSP